MVGFWVLAIVGGQSGSTAKLTEIAFTPAAVLLGFQFWQTSTGAYLGFIWQLFFFSCAIRRFTDFQLGWNPTNFAIVAPYLTSIWCCITLLKPRQAFMRDFGLIAAALLWALAIGVLHNGISAAGFAMLEWGTGPLIAAYLLATCTEAESIKSWLIWVSAAGVIVMSLYGIAQYVAPARWDLNWIVWSGMEPVIGLSPGGLRVFSTMNSPWPFAMTLMALLLFLVGSRGWFAARSVAVVSGLIALIASQTRAAWGGLVIGWLVLAICAGRNRGRFLVTGALLGLISGLAVIAMPQGRALTDRLETLGSLRSDDSFSVRARFYQSFAIEALGQPIGAGLGRTGVATRLSNDSSMLHFDSGLMNVPYVLGWVGTLLYVSGLVPILVAVVQGRRTLSPAGVAAAAACVGLLSQMLFLNSLIAASGVIFWTLLGLCLRDVLSNQPAVAISRAKS